LGGNVREGAVRAAFDKRAGARFGSSDEGSVGNARSRGADDLTEERTLDAGEHCDGVVWESERREWDFALLVQMDGCMKKLRYVEGAP